MKLFWLLLCFAISAQAETFSAHVIAVMDGDTLFVQSGGLKAKVRLLNIDAPEKDQPYGVESTASLQSLIGGKTVQIETQAIDQYGRTLALVSVDGINVNEEQVRRGMAWAYSRSRASRHYSSLQSAAQQARLGLWHRSDPQKPSQWRKIHPPVKSHDNTQVHHETARVFDLSCGKKRHCSQMVTCDEAHFYLTQCGVHSLDSDGDGLPCEALCGGKKSK